MPARLRKVITRRKLEFRRFKAGATGAAPAGNSFPAAPSLALLALAVILLGRFRKVCYDLPVPAEAIGSWVSWVTGFPVVWRSWALSAKVSLRLISSPVSPS